VNEEFAVLMVFFAISATLNVAMGFGWIRSSLRARRFEKRLLTPPPPPTDAATEQLERTVESLAAQVDQLHSGQEFLNRVLTERFNRLGRGLPPQEVSDETPR